MSSRRAPTTASMTDAECLRQWALTELKIPGLSDDCDLSYICRGDLVNIWNYVRRNVINSDRASLVHGNLRLHTQLSKSSNPGTSNDNKLHNKIRQYKKLIEEVNKQETVISALESAIEQQQAKLLVLSQKERRKRSHLHEARVKACLLAQHQSVLSNHSFAVLRKFQGNLQTLLDKYNLEKQRAHAAAAYSTHSEGGNQNIYLVQLRNLHKSVSDFFNKLLDGELSKSELQKEKAKIKTLLAQAMSSIGPSSLLKFIIYDVKKQQEGILEDAEHIDYTKDAEALRFRVVAEGFIDDSVGPTLDSSVDQLIEQSQIEHQQRFLETDQHRVNAILFRKRQSELKSHIDSNMHLPSTAEHNTKMKVIKEIIDMEVAENQTRAALTVVNDIKQFLEQQVESSSDQVFTLKQKFKSISSFRADVHSKQNQICVLMKQNVMCEEKLNQRQSLLTTTITTLVSNAEPLVSLNRTTIRENYTIESRQLYNIPLYSLSLNPHTTIRALEDASGKAGKDVALICNTLEFRRFLTNDTMVKRILMRQIEIIDSYMHAPVLSDLANSKSHTDYIQCVLLPQARQQTEKTIRELVPKLRQSKDLANKALSTCDTVSSLVEVWWHQPGLRIILQDTH